VFSEPISVREPLKIPFPPVSTSKSTWDEPLIVPAGAWVKYDEVAADIASTSVCIDEVNVLRCVTSPPPAPLNSYLESKSVNSCALPLINEGTFVRFE